MIEDVVVAANPILKTAVARQRCLFIDMLRCGAVVFMLQGHAFDAFLKSSVKQAGYYYLHDFLHGFVAPIFLFASGLAFGIATFQNWEAYLGWSVGVRRRLLRFGGLMLVGYALHLPFFSLRKIIYDSSPQEIADFLQVDALQCIGVTLGGLQLLVLFLKRQRYVAMVSLLLSVLVILLSPWIWNASFGRLFPLGLASYLNGENKSWFPLFPWSAYLLLGTAYAYRCNRAEERGEAGEFMDRSAHAGFLIVVLSLLASWMPVHFLPAHDYWKVNPVLNFLRGGVLLVVTSLVFRVEHLFRVPPSLPAVIGRESLTIYVAHLMIIYGSVINPGLELNWRGCLDLSQASMVFGALLLSLIAFAYLWHHLKRNFKDRALLLKLALAATLLLSFVTRPY